MPFVKIYIHFVWSTKKRIPFLSSKEIRLKVWNHIRENAKSKGIFVDFVGGYSDHCHCLISLGIDQKVKDIIQLIKGESSYWINKQKFCKDKFQWQNDYFAASVSELQLIKTRDYIKNQENHHAKSSSENELESFLKVHGFKEYKE